MHDICAIYFARGLTSGLIKIGRTHSVPERLRALACRVEPVELIASLRAPASMERYLHRRFASALEPSRGREWFRDDGRILAFVERLPASQRGSVVFVPGAPKRRRSPEEAKRAADAWARPAREESEATRARRNAAMDARRERVAAARLADPLLYPLHAKAV